MSFALIIGSPVNHAKLKGIPKGHWPFGRRRRSYFPPCHGRKEKGPDIPGLSFFQWQGVAYQIMRIFTPSLLRYSLSWVMVYSP